MTWCALHQGPGGVLSRSEHSNWDAAANWLRAMMHVSSPDGIRPHMLALANYEIGEPFSCTVSGHRFELRDASAPVTAADLFEAAERVA